MAQTTSRVNITVDGDPLRSMPGASIDHGIPERTAVTLDDGNSDYAEVPRPSAVVATLSHVAGYDIIAIGQWRNVTLNYTTDTGDGWVINNAWVALVGELATGEFQVTFNGPPARRI